MKNTALAVSLSALFAACQSAPAASPEASAASAPAEHAAPASAPAPARQYAYTRTPEEWRKALGDERFHILREQGTEQAFTGKHWNNHEAGTYVCGGCGQPLFASADKFDSGTGWPSYTRPIDAKNVETESDTSYGMVRTEARCSRCGGHLGHVFNDGPEPTGQRWCIDSASLDFVPEGQSVELALKK